MALTRKFLAAMSIDEDKIEQIISAHTDTVNGLKEEIEKYKPNAEKLPDVQKELDKVNKKLSELESEDHESPYKKKYDDLKIEFDKIDADFKKYKADIDAKALLDKKSSAYRKLLKDAGVSEKRLDTIMKVTSLDNVELQEDGSIKDSENLTTNIKSEWADFIVKTDEKGAETPNPPAGAGGAGAGESLGAKLAQRYHNNLYGSKEA